MWAMTVWNRNTEALNQMAVGPVKEHEGDTVEPHAEVRLWPRTHCTHCTHAPTPQSCDTHTQTIISTWLYSIYNLVSFSWVVFMDVCLLKLSLCGPGDPNLPCLWETPKTTKNHKHSTLYSHQHTTFSYLLHTVPTFPSQLETTAANGDADASKHVHHIINLKVSHPGPPKYTSRTHNKPFETPK